MQAVVISAVGGILYLAIKHIFSDNNNNVDAQKAENNKREDEITSEHSQLNTSSIDQFEQALSQQFPPRNMIQSPQQNKRKNRLTAQTKKQINEQKLLERRMMLEGNNQLYRQQEQKTWKAQVKKRNHELLNEKSEEAKVVYQNILDDIFEDESEQQVKVQDQEVDDFHSPPININMLRILCSRPKGEEKLLKKELRKIKRRRQNVPQKLFELESVISSIPNREYSEYTEFSLGFDLDF